ncbi:MAG: hypothetical protein JXR97_05725, partial [Planctomycetes bacterium]|nr:hypothetical protein [Planctomycetota bacterium]
MPDRDKTTQIFKKEPEKRPSRRRRWIIRGLYILMILAGYRILIWSLLHMVDERAIANNLDDWMEQTLVADISIDNIQSDLSFRGKAKLSTEEFIAKHPNDLFSGNFIRIDPLSMTCPVYGLWGMPCEPEVNIRNMAVNIKWEGDSFDDCSLLGLADPLDEPKKRAEIPFADMNAPIIRFRVKKSWLNLYRLHRKETVEIKLDSSMTLDTKTGELSGTCKPSTVVYTPGDAGKSPYTCSLHLTEFSCFPKSYEPGKGMKGKYTLGVENFPVKLLNMIWPGILPEIDEIKLSGIISYDNGKIDVKGHLGGFLPEGVSTGLIEVRTSRNAEGKWSPLRAKCDFMNLDALPPLKSKGRIVWLGNLLDVFNSVEVTATSIQLLGMPIHEATLVVGILKNHQNQSGLIIRGKRIGGKTDDSLPVSPLGIQGIGWQPTGGEIEIIVAHNPESEDNADGSEAPIWTSGATIRNLSIPTKDAGTLYRELSRIPTGLGEVEAL